MSYIFGFRFSIFLWHMGVGVWKSDLSNEKTKSSFKQFVENSLHYQNFKLTKS